MQPNHITAKRLSARHVRLALGWVVVIAGSALLMTHALQWMGEHMTRSAWRALEGGGLCALATALGALPVLFTKGLPVRLSDGLLGFGAGVMLAATAFSLVVPGLSAAQGLGFSKWGAGAVISAGVMLGIGAMLWLDHAWPHAHFDTAGHATRPAAPAVRARVWLFVVAIILHNIPEGMAVGVAMGADLANANGLAMGIALQDVPEGLVVALALAGAGLPRGKAALIGMASGLVEPVSALMAALAVGLFSALLPWGLAFAAGAMLFAVSHEVIPESHRNGHETAATLGLALGFCLMMTMDTALA
jgi:ZIP family zinc transporter